MDTAELISKIEAHCASRGVAVTSFGRAVVNDGKLVSRLRDGGTLTMPTYAKILAALSQDEPGAA